MGRTSEEISRSMRAKLRILDPEISAEPLTIERKVIDTVADAIAESEHDQLMLTYQFDINTKIGGDLDRFVALFGFARQEGRRATGTVTFTRSSTSTTDIYIPVGTQIVKPATAVSPAVIFLTTTNAIIYSGTSSVDVSVQCSEVGSIGNVPANTITVISQASNTGISEVSNAVATSSGVEAESDAELRLRFKNTIFRNVSGTQDQYLALAIASKFTQKANVIGPVSRFSEYLQIPSGLSVNSQIPYAQYTYPFDDYLTDGVPGNETFFSPNGADFTFTTNNISQTIPLTPVAPTLTVNNTTNIPVNSIVLLEHAYCSISSRNDPANNKLNFTDIFISGSDVVEATESLLFPSTTFNNTSSSKYYYKKFARVLDGSYPLQTNLMQELLWQPVEFLPTSIQIGTNTFYLNSHYWLVRDISNYQGSKRARNGIEWAASVLNIVTAGTAFSITYSFDRLPLEVNELVDAHKQVTSDVLVHSANLRYFIVNLTIMYSNGFSPSSVDNGITTNLTDFFSKQQFGPIIQLSDIEDIVHNVSGVDNVRITKVSDNVGTYGIQEVSSSGAPIGLPLTNDFALKDSDLIVLDEIQTFRKSQNTWNF